MRKKILLFLLIPVLAWGQFGKNVTIKSVTMKAISPSTYYTLEDWFNVTQSPGKISGGDFIDNGDGSIKVAAGEGIIKTSNSYTAPSFFFSWDTTSISLTNDTTNYIYISYNSGSPSMTAGLSMPTDKLSNLLLGLVYRNGTTLHMIPAGQVVSGYANRDFWKDVSTNSKFSISSGVKISESGERYIQITSGVVYSGLTTGTFPAFNSSVTAITGYYRDGSGSWNTASINQLDNQYYDDGSGSLATLNNNYKTNRYIYIDPDGHVFLLFGQNQYNSLGSAIEEEVPSDIPDILKNIGMLRGKIIIKKGETHFERVYNISGNNITYASVASHSELSDILGSGEYHFSETQHDSIVDWMDDVILGSNGSLALIDSLRVVSSSNSANIKVISEAIDSSAYVLLRTKSGTWKIENDEEQSNYLNFTWGAGNPDLSITIAGDINTNGKVSGETYITLDTDATVALAASHCRNRIRINDDADAIDYTLPYAESGLVVTFYDLKGGVITIDPHDASDTIYLDGVSVGAGDAIDSDGNIGSCITLIAIDDTRWITINKVGTWVDGGAD